MGKTLVIAEKPSVGRDIGKVLGCSKNDEGFIYNDEYIVSWAVGHLATLCEPEDYDPKLKSWRLETLPIIPAEMKLKPVSSTHARKQLNILKKLMNSKDVGQIICATDSGREGELIFRYIYTIVKCTKPFKRLWISSMTDAAIKEGFSKIKDGSEYNDLYMSAKCRSEADWLVGMNASRAFTVKYKALLSIGRVQTPTLAIITQKQHEINDFTPRDYWEIQALFDSSAGSYTGLWYDEKENDSKIFEKEKANNITGMINGKTGVVESVEIEEKKQPPSLLYDLTELQRDCNKKFGYSAQKTLTIAQDLYEKKKLITYPRTDSRYLSGDMKGKVKSTLNKLNTTEYSQYTGYVIALNEIPFTKRIIDDSKVSDHHAIIPADIVPKLNTLNPEERNVFDLIVRKFVAAFYPHYITDITKIKTRIEKELFISKGTAIKQLGWMELYEQDKVEKEDEEDVIPSGITKDLSATVTWAKCKQKKTQPPKPYTEATLLSAMENAGRFIEDDELKEKLKESGLGTPATRAAIIERLIKVGYIIRKGKSVIPTDKGMKLAEIVPHELKSPETTGKWEKGLSSIAKGKMDAERFMESINRYVNYLVNCSEKADTSVSFPEDTNKKKASRASAICKCPKCQNGNIFENTKAYYCSEWKSGCNFNLWKSSAEKYGYQLTKAVIKELCENNIVKAVSIVMPGTGENQTADLVLNNSVFMINPL